MKKALIFLCLILGINLYAQDFVVKNYEVEIFLEEDNYFDVVEKYEVFFKYERHGLLRYIITHYDFVDQFGQAGERDIYISDIEVPGHRFKASSSIKRKWEDQVEIKIGDPKKYVSGTQYYEIRYRVKNALIFSKDQTQLYWNIKPNDWNANFEKIKFTIHVPKGVELKKENSFVYSGFYGELNPGKFDLEFKGNQLIATSKENVISYYGQSVTALVKLPEGAIAYVDYTPSEFRQTAWIWILLLPIIWFIRIWVKHGKDDRVPAVTSYYPPVGVDPAMAGFIIDDTADAVDLVALIPKWGNEGLVRVEEIKKKGLVFDSSDIRLHRLGEISAQAPDYEQTMFNDLFEMEDEKLESVLISDLKEKFHESMTLAKKQLEEKAQIYYLPKSRSLASDIGFYSMVLGAGVSFILFYFFGKIAAVFSVIVFVALIFFSRYMIKKNPSGNEALAELKGFKNFIKLAEVHRIKVLLESDPEYFEKTMSYALAFGLLKQWGNKFSGLDVEPPDWYTGNSVGLMNMNSFANSFSNSMSSAQSNLVSSPSSSSSGGGYSGGGFGGGGGGSW